MTQIQIQTSPVKVLTVGKSWTQQNRDLYGSWKVPRCKVLGPAVGTDGHTTYELGKLENFMRGLRRTTPGMPRGTSATLKGGTVDAVVSMFETHTRDRSSIRPLENRFEDLQFNLVPGIQGEAMVAMDEALITFCTDASVWGAAKTFTGGPVQDNGSSLRVVEQINDNLLELVQYNQFKRVCIMDRTTSLVLRQANAYRDGANTQNMLTDEMFKAKFMSNHDVEEVIILGSANNTARPGQTAVIQTTGRGLLWFGLLDRNQDLSMRDGYEGPKPDGSLVLFYEDLPVPDNWLEEADRLELFRSTVTFGYANPRKQSDNVALGFFFDPSTILTSP